MTILERFHGWLDGLPEWVKIVGLGAIGVAVFATAMVSGVLEEDGDRVNRAVEREYLRRARLTGSVEADCTWVKEVETTPEWWVCDISGPPPWGADVCNVDVTRDGVLFTSITPKVTAKITYCFSDDAPG